MSHRIFLFLLTALFSAIAQCAIAANENENICIIRRGAVLYETDASSVDSAAVNGGSVTLFDKSGNVLYATASSQIDSIRFLPAVPKADLFDVVFNTDGSTEDVSPMRNSIRRSGNTGSLFSNRFGRFIARFTDNPWGGTNSTYYRLDYDSNTAFKNALADGHSIEILVKSTYSGTISDVESKPFCSHQGGGTGILISKISGTRKNELTFLPHVGGSYRWATSGIVPQSGRFYHVVGVWDKKEGKAKIYVDGVLKNTVTASGELTFPSSGCNWFSIAGDPSSSTVSNTAWNGDIAIARIYDDALTSEQVIALWNRIQTLGSGQEHDAITDVSYITNLPILEKSVYNIEGKGFKEGDKIQFTNIKDTSKSATLNTSLTENEGVLVTLSSEITPATYRMMLYRNGTILQDLGTTSFDNAPTIKKPRGGQVIAHRGYYTSGTAQNSRESLKRALALKDIYGSETDCWLTTDGKVVINHDATLGGVTLQTSTFEQVKNLTLSNGEKIPTLKEFLEILAQDQSDVKLIIEVKKHSSDARSVACIDSCMALVKQMNLENKVEYISFSLAACREVVNKNPKAKVAYLNGDIDPSKLCDYGIAGIDYTSAKTTDSYISQCHEMGMSVNVWTIDSAADIIYENSRDVDFVTTNYPELAQKIYMYFKRNQ